MSTQGKVDRERERKEKGNEAGERAHERFGRELYCSIPVLYSEEVSSYTCQYLLRASWLRLQVLNRGSERNIATELEGDYRTRL